MLTLSELRSRLSEQNIYISLLTPNSKMIFQSSSSHCRFDTYNVEALSLTPEGVLNIHISTRKD